MAGSVDQTPNSDSLNWLAVQYVLGELTESEAFAFEARLETDLAACEAVAEATQLTLALRSTEAVSQTTSELERPSFVERPAAPVRSGTATTRGSWLALSGAISAVAVLFAAMSFGPAGVPTTQLAAVDRSASELVSLWRIGSDATEPDFDEADVELAEAGHEVAVPSWLVMAVSLEESKPGANPSDEWQEN